MRFASIWGFLAVNWIKPVDACARVDYRLSQCRSAIERLRHFSFHFRSNAFALGSGTLAPFQAPREILAYSTASGCPPRPFCVGVL